VSSNIESYDRKRKRLRSGRVLGLVAFWMLFKIRSARVVAGWRPANEWTAMETALTLCVLVLAFFSFRLVFVERAIRRDPLLREALYNEMHRLNDLKAWRAALFCVMGLNAVMAFVAMAVPLRDPMILIVGNLLVGFGGFDVARYVLDR
jgi:hypothetical protein